MQEVVEEKTYNLCISTTRLTGRVLLEAYRAKQRKKAYGDHLKHGKQKLKDILKHGRETDSIEVNSDDMRDFKQVAKQYGIDFAIRRDKTFQPPKYFVFFKTTDVNALTSMMKEVGRRQKLRAERPSVRVQLQKLIAAVKAIPDRIRERVEERTI